MSTGKLLGFALFLILSPSVSWAQGSRAKEVVITPSVESQSALVRQSFANELQSILQKYLKPHQYAIDVMFKLPADLKGVGDVPYAPDSIISESFQGLPNATQLKKLQGLEVRVLVPQWMDNQTKSTLKNLMAKRLEQLTGSAVRLELQGVPLNVEEPPKPVPTQLSGNVAGGSSSTKELEDLKIQMQKERAQFKEELKDLQDRLAGSENVNTSSSAESRGSFQDFWAFAKANPLGAAVVILLIYVAVFTLAFLPSRSLSSGLTAFQNALSSIAKSIKGVADAMARSSSGGGSSDAERPQTAALPGPAQSGPGAVLSKFQQPSYPELREILQMVQKQHQVRSDPMVMEMLQGFLAEDKQAFKSVLVLELLGPQHANRIFEQLLPDQKDRVLELINHAETAAGDKTETLYELAETYQTRLMASGWKGGIRSALDEQLQRTIAHLKSEELPVIARQLRSEDELRRLMLYLDASSLIQLIQSFKRNPQEKTLVLKSLAAMPEALDSLHLDQEISATVEQFLAKKRQDRYLPYLAHFETIVSQSGEDMEDDLIEQISRSNPAVGRHLRRRVVTIGSFFMQPIAIQSELLGPFSNYELAVLIASFPDEQKKGLLLACIEPRRRELVQEQMHMLVDENKYTLADTQRSIKARLKDALRSHRGNQADEIDDGADEADSTTQVVAA